MTRKDFIEKSILMGIGYPLLLSLLPKSCSKAGTLIPEISTSFRGKVMVVGAGATGLAAGYLLKQLGVPFEILEAASTIGGRMKSVKDFSDFPLDVGAEWIHTDPSVLTRIANNPRVNTETEILEYNPQTIQLWKNGRRSSHNYIRNFYKEWKFKNSTWHGFFERYIVPEIANHIRLLKPVSEIEQHSEKITLKTLDGETFEAEKVLVTTPIKTLQNQQIKFLPALPEAKTDAISKVFMGDGIKIFIEFKERFYPDMLAFGNLIQAFRDEEKFVYDAAYRKDSSRHILGLFAINEQAAAYTHLNTDSEIIRKVLTELDQMFEGKATANYIKHIIQNWSKEPYIQGAYSYAFEGNKKEIVKAILEPIANKLYFAGEALSLSNHSMVHGACESAYRVVAQMLEEK